MADGLLRPSTWGEIQRGKGRPKRIFKKITTDKEVQSLKPTGVRYERVVADPKGLVVVVSAMDSRPAFYVRYTPFGLKQRRRLFLGHYHSGVYGLAEAREDALVALADIKKNRADPALEHSRAKKAAHTGEALDDLLQPYLRAATKGLHGGRQVARRASALAQDEYLYGKYIKPALGHRPFRQITSGDLKEFARKLATEADLAAGTVRSIMAVLRALFAFAVHEDKLAANPATALKLPKANKRDRMIDETSLRTIWRALDAVDSERDAGALPLEPEAVRLLQLLFLTGLRRAEVAGAAWSEFDLDAKLWSIPAARMKGGRAHSVPLSDTATKLVKRIKASTEHLGSAHLFPMKGDLEKAVRPDRVTAEFARLVQHLKLPTFSPHDVRRTCTTVLTGRYAVPEKHMSHVLAHSMHEGAAVTGQYNLHTYLPEKRAALAKWARHLEALLRDDTGPKIVKLELRGRT